MRVAGSTNALLTIEACPRKNDYLLALKVAQRMVANSHRSIEIAEVDEQCGFIVLSAVWDNFQRSELRDQYAIAKEEVG